MTVRYGENVIFKNRSVSAKTEGHMSNEARIRNANRSEGPPQVEPYSPTRKKCAVHFKMKVSPLEAAANNDGHRILTMHRPQGLLPREKAPGRRTLWSRKGEAQVGLLEKFRLLK
jgi:hypothetical protein